MNATLFWLTLGIAWISFSYLRRDPAPLPNEIGRITEIAPLAKWGLIGYGFLAIVSVVSLIGGYNASFFIAFLAFLCCILVHMEWIPCLRYNADGYATRTFLGLVHYTEYPQVLTLQQKNKYEYTLKTPYGKFGLHKNEPSCAAFLNYAKTRCQVKALLPERKRL